MKDIKKLMITLVALLAVTTGAWAQAPTIYCQQDYSDGVADWTSGNTGRYTVDMNEGKYLTVNAVGNGNNGTTITGTTVNQVIPAGEDFEKSGDFTMSFDLQLTDGNNRSSWFHINDASNDNGGNETVGTHMLTLQAAAANSTKWKINGSETQTLDLAKATWYSFTLTKKGAKLYLTVVPTAGGDALMNEQLITVNSTVGGLGNMIFETNRYYAFMAIDNVLVSEVVDDAAPTGPEVDWDKDKKTGQFTMPGGNVTLEPEYYPQAAVADGGVTAADADARATTDDPLVKVDATKLTGAKKLMYFVSNSGTTAPAYDAEGWTDQLPTAEGLAQQGIVYVWYYPVGTDEGVDGATATYSDGDICLQSITARIAAAPTYAVTFADDLAEPDKWTASPAANVTKGQTVTVTYSGTKKVIGVKAEKKAAEPAGPITVTWNNDDITGSGKSFTKDGVTITAGAIDFSEKNFFDGGTFSTTLGNFTKIEVTTSMWLASGTGWSGSTWTGNASSVSFSGKILGMDSGNTKFVFTIEPAN